MRDTQWVVVQENTPYETTAGVRLRVGETVPMRAVKVRLDKFKGDRVAFMMSNGFQVSFRDAGRRARVTHMMTQAFNMDRILPGLWFDVSWVVGVELRMGYNHCALQDANGLFVAEVAHLRSPFFIYESETQDREG
jgi:hypothetical protein